MLIRFLASIAALIGVALLAWWLHSEDERGQRSAPLQSQHYHSTGQGSSSAEPSSLTLPAERPHLGVSIAPCTEPDYPNVCASRDTFLSSLTDYFDQYDVAQEQRSTVLAILADAQGELEILMHANSVARIRGEAPEAPEDDEDMLAAQEQIMVEAYRRIAGVLTADQRQGWSRTFRRYRMMADLLMHPFEVPAVEELRQQLTDRLVE